MTLDSRPEVSQESTSRWAAFNNPLTPYYVIVGAATLLIALGLVMVLSASSVTSYADSGSSFAIGLRQAMWVAIGIPCMWLASRLPVSFYRRYALAMVIVAFALLFALFVPGLGVSVNGNRNWIEFGGPFRLQPSEFAKFAWVVWAASLLARKEAEGRDWAFVLQRMSVVAGGMLLLVIVSGDLGTSLVLMAVTVALMFFAGIPMRILGILVVAGLAGIAYLSASRGYRRDRFTSWLDPGSDPLGAGWQALHGTYALASGGWWGVGLGASREKWGDLPEAHTDFIFAVIGEEFGLFGTLIVLALLTAICVSGVVVALRTQDTFVRLAAAGAVTWIAVQAIVNIGAVLQLLPITGIPLPLVSYGGSALIPTMCVIGMLLTFARREPAAAAAFALRGPGPIRRLLAEPARRPDLRSVNEQGS